MAGRLSLWPAPEPRKSNPSAPVISLPRGPPTTSDHVPITGDPPPAPVPLSRSQEPPPTPAAPGMWSLAIQEWSLVARAPTPSTAGSATSDARTDHQLMNHHPASGAGNSGEVPAAVRCAARTRGDRSGSSAESPRPATAEPTPTHTASGAGNSGEVPAAVRCAESTVGRALGRHRPVSIPREPAGQRPVHARRRSIPGIPSVDSAHQRLGSTPDAASRRPWARISLSVSATHRGGFGRPQTDHQLMLQRPASGAGDSGEVPAAPPSLPPGSAGAEETDPDRRLKARGPRRRSRRQPTPPRAPATPARSPQRPRCAARGPRRPTRIVG